MDEQKLALTAFLLKPNQLTKLKDVLVGGKDIFPLANPLEGFFLPVPSSSTQPQWVEPVRSILQATNLPTLLGQSPSGVLVIVRGIKTFVITFGHAWQQLEDEWLEPDFGRRVALNSIPRDQLVEIRAEQVFAKWHVADERAPRASSVDEFGVEFDRDLVAVVEGVPSEPIAKLLGKSVRGGTSLRVKIPFDTLADALDKSGNLFDSDAYKKVWPEIDNITPVKDQTLIEKLEQQLNADFTSGKAQKQIIMFIPSRREENVQSIESYVFGNLTKFAASTPLLNINGWLTYLAARNKPASVEEAKRSRIHLIDELKEEAGAYTIFDCFGYEVPLKGLQYILSAGIWYEVVPDFLSRVNKTANDILPPKTNLVPWQPPESEGEYNLRCATTKKFLFFDAKNVMYGNGQSKFEFCDFLDPKTKTLFFAKIGSKSSGISHLVEQVRRTSELLFSTDDGYRKKLGEVFAKYHPTADAQWLKARPKNGDWNMCLVSLGKNALQLPFFARCGIVRLYKDLSARGHPVAFTAV